MTAAFDLDHVAVVVRDLDVAQKNFARLGFTLTPRSSHKGPNPETGRFEPWGSGNHCAMFRQGYLELLGITDPTRYKAHVEARLARYEGLHLIAFGSGDAKADAAALRARGVAIAEPRELGRDVPYGTGTRPGRFAIAHLDAERYPEADFIVIEQQTREVLWQPALLDHPNGAVSLDSVTLCPADAAEFRERFEPVLGHTTGGGFNLSPGRLEVVTPAELRRRCPKLAEVKTPRVIAMRIGVAEIPRTRAWLKEQAVPLIVDDGDLLRVDGEHCCGAVVEFAKSEWEGSRS